MNESVISWRLPHFLEGVADARQFADVRITGVSQTDQDMSSGDLFFALAGRKVHGLAFVGKAREMGVTAVGWEPCEHIDLPPLPDDLPCVRIENLSTQVGQLAARFYGYPSEYLNVLAVTGTDGKSSVSLLLAQALQALQQTCGVVGTLGVGLPDELRPSRYTTPPQTLLQKELHCLLVEDKCRYVAIEASSHALDQQRFSQVKINTAILTNITRDHLDYHRNRDHYVAAKSRLFFDSSAQNCVINIDDETGRSWLPQLKQNKRVLTYSTERPSSPVEEHIYARSIRAHADGLTFELQLDQQIHEVKMSLYGLFNVSNVLAVAVTLYAQGFSLAEIAVALNRLSPVKGRMQAIKSPSGPVIVIDYAHTPAALEAALSSMRQHFNGALCCVFGCGGNRDRGKRSEMGEVAARLADKVIVTSDNPRDEDPVSILEEIAGPFRHEFILQVDRQQAIWSALTEAGPSDAILIAGKGHESTQEIAGKFIPFSDYSQVKQMLQRGLSHA